MRSAPLDSPSSPPGTAEAERHTGHQRGKPDGKYTGPSVHKGHEKHSGYKGDDHERVVERFE